MNCLDTTAHAAHDTCPGLDPAQVRAAVALTVPCSECHAPPGTPCRSNYDGTTHGERLQLADLRSLDQGTCGLCGRWMVRGTVLDAPLDAWHPVPDDAADCPVLPDPATDWTGYAAAINLGQAPGHPGLEYFRPALDPDKTCPECRQGKCGNCTFTVPVGDGPEVIPCACGTAGHPSAPRMTP